MVGNILLSTAEQNDILEGNLPTDVKALHDDNINVIEMGHSDRDSDQEVKREQQVDDAMVGQLALSHTVLKIEQPTTDLAEGIMGIRTFIVPNGCPLPTPPTLPGQSIPASVSAQIRDHFVILKT